MCLRQQGDEATSNGQSGSAPDGCSVVKRAGDFAGNATGCHTFWGRGVFAQFLKGIDLMGAIRKHMPVRWRS